MGEAHPKVPYRHYQCLPRAQTMGKSPDVQFGIQFSTWNVGSILEKWGEISDFEKMC